VVHVQGSSGYHEMVVLGWMEGDGGEVGSSCHKGSSQDMLVNERGGLHPTMEHAYGCMGYNHEVVCYQSKEPCEPLAPCGLYQSLFGFLDHERDLRNLSQVWILPLF